MTTSVTHPARAAAQRSMAAVSRGAKQELLALFAENAVVEDPVGPSMFDPDGTISAFLPGNLRVDTEGVFVYRVDASGLITSLRAFWETDRALATMRQV